MLADSGTTSNIATARFTCKCCAFAVTGVTFVVRGADESMGRGVCVDRTTGAYSGISPPDKACCIGGGAVVGTTTMSGVGVAGVTRDAAMFVVSDIGALCIVISPPSSYLGDDG